MVSKHDRCRRNLLWVHAIFTLIQSIKFSGINSWFNSHSRQRACVIKSQSWAYRTYTTSQLFLSSTHFDIDSKYFISAQAREAGQVQFLFQFLKEPITGKKTGIWAASGWARYQYIHTYYHHHHHHFYYYVCKHVYIGYTLSSEIKTRTSDFADQWFDDQDNLNNDEDDDRRVSKCSKNASKAWESNSSSSSQKLDQLLTNTFGRATLWHVTRWVRIAHYYVPRKGASFVLGRKVSSVFLYLWIVEFEGLLVVVLSVWVGPDLIIGILVGIESKNNRGLEDAWKLDSSSLPWKPCGLQNKVCMSE